MESVAASPSMRFVDFQQLDPLTPQTEQTLSQFFPEIQAECQSIQLFAKQVKTLRDLQVDFDRDVDIGCKKQSVSVPKCIGTALLVAAAVAGAFALIAIIGASPLSIALGALLVGASGAFLIKKCSDTISIIRRPVLKLPSDEAIERLFHAFVVLYGASESPLDDLVQKYATEHGFRRIGEKLNQQSLSDEEFDDQISDFTEACNEVGEMLIALGEVSEEEDGVFSNVELEQPELSPEEEALLAAADQQAKEVFTSEVYADRHVDFPYKDRVYHFRLLHNPVQVDGRFRCAILVESKDDLPPGFLMDRIKKLTAVSPKEVCAGWGTIENESLFRHPHPLDCVSQDTECRMTINPGYLFPPDFLEWKEPSFSPKWSELRDDSNHIYRV